MTRNPPPEAKRRRPDGSGAERRRPDGSGAERRRPDGSTANYHHGDLRAAILTEAARLVAERGDAGVSHAAPAHHFTDRRGLFTALAAEGYRILAAALTDVRPRFVDAALAYVQ